MRLTKTRLLSIVVLLLSVVVSPVAVLTATHGAGAASSITPLYPDLRALTPTNKMFISHPAGQPKLFSYTHIIYNAGPGPLELRPTYDPATDTADAVQRLYGRDGSGN